MKLFKKAKKGFTLVELVVVIAVIAILAAVSVGAYFGVTESAKNSKADQEAKALHTSIMLVINNPDIEGLDYDEKTGTLNATQTALVNALKAVAGLNYAEGEYNKKNKTAHGFISFTTNDDEVKYTTTDNVERYILIKTGEIKSSVHTSATQTNPEGQQ